MRASKGFTLIELMITVAVVAVLAAVGYPSYTNYLIRGKLAEGASALSDARVKMEQFFQDNRSYTSATLGANGCPTTFRAPPDTINFQYRCTDLSATTYTLNAVGRDSLAGFTYTLNQNNAKVTTAAPSGWAAAAMPAPCWISKKNGVC